MQINLSGHNNIIMARKPMKPALPISKSTRFSPLYPRSARNKTLSLKDLALGPVVRKRVKSKPRVKSA